VTARLSTRCFLGLLAVCLLTLAAIVGALPASAADTTDPTTLVGEGGSFLTPLTDLLLKADTAGIAPLNPSYTDANLDNAITDFIGDGPGSFDADFVVSERPLTTDEAATAKSNGRTFAYVPFAATPVAVATLAVCN
jgi:ABC-type phosphate transport system substrate-binding protein